LAKDYSLRANYFDIFQNESLKLISNLDIKGNILITGSQGMLGNALACAIRELQKIKILNESKLILCSRNWQIKEAEYWQNSGNIEVLSNDE